MAPLVLDDADIDRVLDIIASHDAVAALSAAIPAVEWDAFNDRVLEEQTYPEIADRLQCSEALIRKRVSRARAHLRTALGEHHA